MSGEVSLAVSFGHGPARREDQVTDNQFKSSEPYCDDPPSNIV